MSTMSIDAGRNLPAAADQRAVLAGRARRLLVAGFLGGHLGGLLALLVWALLDGSRGAISALLGFALAIVFQSVGQFIQIQFAASRPTSLMAASMLSFGIRAGLLLMAFGAWTELAPQVQARFDVLALTVGIAATVVGWLVAVVITHSRLRIPVFDLPVEESEGGRR